MGNQSEQLYEKAQQYLPGGVSATARYHAALGRPLFMSYGDGAMVYDIDGNAYIDMCISHGASLLGHNHPKIKTAIMQALEMGVICSYETEYHTELARRLSEIIPCGEMSRFSGSGTETLMHAVRLARTATGRQKILKIEGHFHGYADELNFSWTKAAGPAHAPLPIAESSGIPPALAHDVIVIPYNDKAALDRAFEAHADEIAMLIMEPVNYDSGCILPQPGYIDHCRNLCDSYDVILFFDEVLTAFRLALGGAQEYFGVTPDLCVLGKAFGGGTPISAISGKREVMMHMRPVGDSEHSGTYLAHLTTVLAALAAINTYSEPGFYDSLNARATVFYEGFQDVIDRSGVPVLLKVAGPRFGLHFGLTEDIHRFRDTLDRDEELENIFVRACLERGVYFHVSPHHGFSAVHTDEQLGEVLNVVADALQVVKQAARSTVSGN